MTLGMTPASEDFFDSATRLVQGRIGENSIYELLSREGHRLFPDEEFADLFNGVGRRSVPPQVVATYRSGKCDRIRDPFIVGFS